MISEVNLPFLPRNPPERQSSDVGSVSAHAYTHTHTRLDAYILQAVFRLAGTSLALTDTQEPLLSVRVEWTRREMSE